MRLSVHLSQLAHDPCSTLPATVRNPRRRGRDRRGSGTPMTDRTVACAGTPGCTGHDHPGCRWRRLTIGEASTSSRNWPERTARPVGSSWHRQLLPPTSRRSAPPAVQQAFGDGPRRWWLTSSPQRRGRARRRHVRHHRLVQLPGRHQARRLGRLRFVHHPTDGSADYMFAVVPKEANITGNDVARATAATTTR